MEIVNEIVNRFSCRNFIDSPEISQEQIQRIIQCGIISPSDRNRQPWRFIIIKKSEIKTKVLECCMGFESMPSIIIAIGLTKSDYKMSSGQLSYPFELGISAGYMALQATKEGLGSCIIGSFEKEKVEDILGTPLKMQIPLLLFIGYTDEVNTTKNRFDFNRLCNYNHW